MNWIHELFKPCRIGNMDAPNHFVCSAMSVGSVSARWIVTPALVSRYESFASGGAGVVVGGAVFVSENSRLPGHMGALETDDKSTVSGLAQVTERVRSHGAKFVVQITCGGGSVFPYDGQNGGGLDFSADEIDGIIGGYCRAARMCADAGACGAEVQCAHGALPARFMLPEYNLRDDEYGQDRLMFAKRVIAAVRNELGAGFPLWIRVSPINDSVDYVPELLKSGADTAHITASAHFNPLSICPVGIDSKSEAYLRSYAASLSKATDAGVVLSGGIRSLEMMAELLENNTCSAFALGRPFMAETDLVNRWWHEDARPSACISCNACLKGRDGLVECPVFRDRIEGFWESKDLD